MNVISKIRIDLTRPNMGAVVNAVQGDGNTRSVEIILLADGKPWTPPAGVDVAICYQQPGGTRGMYDLLADGTPAISIAGSVATVILAPQMLAASGTVQASLVFDDAALNRLTTFPFTVSVARTPAAGATVTEDYIRLQWLEDKLDDYVQKIMEGIIPGGGSVSSVNGKTGVVELSAEDVHAMPDTTEIPTVPTKVSAFENDAGYLTKHQDISGKVDKVEGKELSTNDYDNAAKEKVDAIPEDPKYTDTVTPVDATLKNEGEAADAKAVWLALSQIKDDKLDAPATPPDAAGKVLRVLSVDEDGTFTCEWADAPIGGGAVNDVLAGGVSIVTDGVANIPNTSYNVPTLITIDKSQSNPFVFTGANTLDLRWGSIRGVYGHLVPRFSQIEDSVIKILTDGKSRALTDVERIAALLHIGCTVDVNGFVKWTAQEVSE